MRDKLKARLKHLDVEFKFDREEETLRIVRIDNQDRKSTRLNSSHIQKSRMPSSA